MECAEAAVGKRGRRAPEGSPAAAPGMKRESVMTQDSFALTLPARPHAVSVVRHVLGGTGDAWAISDEQMARVGSETGISKQP